MKLANAVIISRDPLDPSEVPMAELRRGGQQQASNKAEHNSTFDDRGKSGSIKAASQEPSVLQHAFVDISPADDSVHVTPSSDLTMATDLRAYNEWPGEYTAKHILSVFLMGAPLRPHREIGFHQRSSPPNEL